MVPLLSSFVPVPGGVGVVEAGLTGALVAAGVDPTTALAGVLVYRLLTHVAPIALGATLYVVWRLDVTRRATSAAASGQTDVVPDRAATAVHRLLEASVTRRIELHESAVIE